MKNLFTFLAVCFFVTHAGADQDKKTRAERQKERIEDGVASGKLTRAEADKLLAEQAQIKETRQAFKSDGTISAEERQFLKDARDAASQNIRQEKHDDQANRAKRQELRIENGLKTGELTQQEADKLRAEQTMIKNMRATLKGDGQLSPEDRKLIKEMRDKASKAIHDQKHDKQFVDGTVADNKRDINHRIKNGIENGSLTDAEAKEVQDDRKELRDLRRNLASDGLTDEEVAKIKEKQEALKAKVKELKHNNVSQ